MRLIVALAILPVALVSSWAADRVPRIEWAATPSEYVVSSRDVSFGYLVTREDKSDTQGRRLVRLPFLIMKARQVDPPSDPVLFITGAPGSSALDTLPSALLNPAFEERDLILLEQRGGPHAQPTLACPEVDSLMAESQSKAVGQPPDQVLLTYAIESCARRLRDQGIPLARYSARDSAADADDLRRLLGVAQWNLYGGSYGSRLALTLIRDYPQSVRSAILDSPIPFEVSPDEDAPENALAALKRLFAQCRSDTACSDCHPDLEDKFFRLMRAAGRVPVRVRFKKTSALPGGTLALNSGGVFEVACQGLRDQKLLERLPEMIDRASKGDHQALEPLVTSILNQPKSATGARYAFWSNDESTFEQMSKILDHRGQPREIRKYSLSMTPPEAFIVWPQGSKTSGANVQVRSSTPILIVGGQLDPASTPGWRREIVRNMSRGRLFELRGYGHAPFLTHPCAAAILTQFLSNPVKRLPGDCVEKTAAPPFACEK